MALFAALWLALAFQAATAQQQSATTQATAALQRGDFAAAERILRPEADAHPDDAWTLSLLGCALDNEKKSAEAEAFHEKAVALAPANVDILGNYGTHLWITGQFAKAEAIFTQALAAAPTSQKILYNLAAVAVNAGDYPRARETLQDALAQQPKNVDILYRLAAVNETLKHPEEAAVLLARAERLDPKRADVEKLLAVAATELGALADAAAAWDRYLALEPGDEAARRERAYTATRMGKSDEGIAELERYVERHPDDKTGQLELGQAERAADPKLALDHLDQALRLDPNYAAARLARGEVYFQNGEFGSALPDLEMAASLDPNHAANLDRLGQTYLELDRASDAVRVLRRAAEMEPADSKILLHFGRALADAGQTEESKAVLDRFRALGPEPKGGEPAGVVAYLGMTPEERRTDLRERVEKAVREHPENAEDQLEYLKLSLDSGDAARAAETAKRIAALKPDARVLADAGHALLEARKFPLAQALLQQAGPAQRAQTDLALAIFRGGGNAAAARAGLETLDSIPEDHRDAEFDFAKAEMLEAVGKTPEAVTALNAAVSSAPDRPEIAVRAAAFLLTKKHSAEAGTLLDAGLAADPRNRVMTAMKAAVSESQGQTNAALKLLEELRRRSPEWPAAWAMSGIVLARHEKWEAAARSLESAIGLGAQDSAIYFYLAKADTALNRPADAAKASAKLPPHGDEAAYANCIFDGGLLIGPERQR